MIKRLIAKLKEITSRPGRPRDIALAIAIGVFIGFFPIYGTHTLMSIGLAWALGLNLVIILVATLVNNPWTIAFIYGGSLWIGMLITNTNMDHMDIDWGNMNWETAVELLKVAAFPFIAGCLLVGTVAGVIAYFISLKAVTSYRDRAKKAGVAK